MKGTKKYGNKIFIITENQTNEKNNNKKILKKKK